MKIPATMVTQHPDSATKYIPIQEEPEEGIKSLLPNEQGGLGSEEYMVDYEGKMTPYHQVTQIVMDILEKTDLIPGEDALITPRIPSATQETVFRQLMTLMSIMEANYQASYQIDNVPVFEVIHPMTAEASELIDVKRRFKFVSELSKKEFDLPESFNFHLIPLIEEVPELMNIKKNPRRLCQRMRKQSRRRCKQIEGNVRKIGSSSIIWSNASDLIGENCYC